MFHKKRNLKCVLHNSVCVWMDNRRKYFYHRKFKASAAIFRIVFSAIFMRINYAFVWIDKMFVIDKIFMNIYIFDIIVVQVVS